VGYPTRWISRRRAQKKSKSSEPHHSFPVGGDCSSFLYNKLLVVAENSWSFDGTNGNEEHLSRHGVTPEDAEDVIRGARSPFPLVQDDEKYLVWGPGTGGRLLQVVFVIDPDDAVFVIHARPLTYREKKRYRRRFR